LNDSKKNGAQRRHDPATTLVRPPTPSTLTASCPSFPPAKDDTDPQESTTSALKTEKTFSNSGNFRETRMGKYTNVTMPLANL
jgi:hypothetical protein